MGDQEARLAARLERAASALAAGPAVGSLGGEDSSILRDLGYDDGDGAKAEGRARMLRAAAKFRRLFVLPVPDAPGVVFFGGEADPAVVGTWRERPAVGNL